MLWPQRVSLWFPPPCSADPDSIGLSSPLSLISSLSSIFSNRVIFRNVFLFINYSPDAFLSLPLCFPLLDSSGLGRARESFGQGQAGFGLYKESGVISVIWSASPLVGGGNKLSDGSLKTTFWSCRLPLCEI